MYSVELSKQARRFFATAEPALAKRLADCFRRLEQNPRHNAKPMKGKYKGCLRYRVGDYRMIYSINDAMRTVYVVAIGHRREVYE